MESNYEVNDVPIFAFSMRVYRGFPLFLCLLCLGFAHPATPEDWHNLVQPIGTLLVVEPAATVNARLGGVPPFETTTDVTTTRTGAPQYFVRFYNPTDPAFPSNPVGSWIMRASTVRGLTPAQVRDLFALPSMPTHMTLVLVPSGYNMYTGIAAPIAGWGAGGGQQSKLIGPPWVPSGDFFNQQSVMASILSYRLLAPLGDTNRIAAYLDGRIPAAYSDLEFVYLNLDMLYTDATTTLFRDALDQIGPSRFDLLSASALHAGVLLNDAVDRRIFSLFTGGRGDAASLSHFRGFAPAALDSGKPGGREKTMWIEAAGGLQRAGKLGFNSASEGIFGGTESRCAEHAVTGLSMGFLHSDLDFTGSGGEAGTDYAKLGLYAGWIPYRLFLQVGLTGGLSQSDVRRHIDFPGIDRMASSSLTGWDVNPHMRIGYRLPMEALSIVPTAGLDFFYQHRQGFTETGADSLNLRIASSENLTLRHHLGVGFSRDIAIRKDMVFDPLLQIGWAREYSLDDHALTAGLDGRPDSFTVHGNSGTSDIFTTGAGIGFMWGKTFSFFVHYGLEYREDRTDQMLYAGLDYRF